MTATTQAWQQNREVPSNSAMMKQWKQLLHKIRKHFTNTNKQINKIQKQNQSQKFY